MGEIGRLPIGIIAGVFSGQKRFVLWTCAGAKRAGIGTGGGAGAVAFLPGAVLGFELQKI